MLQSKLEPEMKIWSLFFHLLEWMFSLQAKSTVMTALSSHTSKNRKQLSYKHWILEIYSSSLPFQQFFSFFWYAIVTTKITLICSASLFQHLREGKIIQSPDKTMGEQIWLESPQQKYTNPPVSRCYNQQGINSINGYIQPRRYI